MAETYDYIVAGGGTAGPVIAGRLSENPNVKILLLEAGADSANFDMMHMAGAWTKLHEGETDWNLITPPQPGLNNRTIHVPRGKFLGGSSGSNGTICVRGVEQDYDDWGFPEWSGKEMFRAMRKAENFHPKEWFPHNKEAHGYEGPLGIEPGKSTPLADAFFESFKGAGLPYVPDMFTTGETSRGCGHAMRTTYQGYRTTGSDFVTKSYARPNVTIKTNQVVDKIIIENEGGVPTAKGVEFISKDGVKGKALATKEVIVSGGTYGSPAILMRSGIGPKAHLQELGIPVTVDLPGVGQNLIDHQLIFNMYEIGQEGLTDDAEAHHDPNAFENGYKAWKENKNGWLATFPFGAFAFNRLSERLDAEMPEWRALPREPGRDPMGLTDDQPNLEFFHTVCYGGPPEYTDFPKEGQYALAMCCFLCGMQSRGHVKLKSTDPLQNPEVDHKYMSDKRDLIMMSEGVRWANEIAMEGKGTKGIVKGSWPPGSNHHLKKTNEDWQPFVQNSCSTSYHPVGTCKIGKDEMSVVDQYLNVYGTKGLRVADCSIMPLVHSGHTQMPAYGIGEKAAEYIAAGARR